MRLVDSPQGTPFEPPQAEPQFEARAAFGPGRHYWTMNGLAVVDDGRLRLVIPDESGEPANVVVEAPLETVKITSKPWYSFGTGLFLKIGPDEYTVEPDPIYPGGASPGKIRRARQAARELQAALAA